MNNRKRRIVILAVIIAITSGAVGFGIGQLIGSTEQDPQPGKVSSNQPNTGDEQASDLPLQDGTAIAVDGVVDCLKHKNTDGPQTLECAIGLVSDDGESYALAANDPTLTGSIPTGQNVRVTGTVTLPQDTIIYDIQGVIQVETVEQL